MRYMKLQVQLRSQLLGIELRRMEKTKKKHTDDKENQLDRRVVKLVMLACPGGVVLGYV